MSIENGPRAVIEPKININLIYCFFGISVVLMEAAIFNFCAKVNLRNELTSFS